MLIKKMVALIMLAFIVLSTLPLTPDLVVDASDYNSETSTAIYMDDYDEYLQKYNDTIYKGDEIIYKVDSSVKDGAQVLNGCVLLSNPSDKTDVIVEAPESGLYRIKLKYKPIIEDEVIIELSVKINGKIPFETCESIYLSRLWKDSGKTFIDHIGNETNPKQEQVKETYEQYLLDPDGLHLNGLEFYLDKGKNTITFESISGGFEFYEVILANCNNELNYNDFLKIHNNIPFYDGEDIVVEAEDTYLKSSKELRSLSDRSDPMNTPSDATVSKLNYIGGENWDSSGEWISWKVTAPKSAFYKVSFRYRQTYLENAASIRSFYVDGKLQFSQMGEISFPYATKWNMKVLGDDEPCY